MIRVNHGDALLTGRRHRNSFTGGKEHFVMPSFVQSEDETMPRWTAERTGSQQVQDTTFRSKGTVGEEAKRNMRIKDKQEGKKTAVWTF